MRGRRHERRGQSPAGRPLVTTEDAQDEPAPLGDGPGMSRLGRSRCPSDADEHEELVDELLIRYVDWREASAAVDSAYESWAGARAIERARCFTTYRVALDREESTAWAYSGIVDRVMLPRPT
jgi:hypothetical protein